VTTTRQLPHAERRIGDVREEVTFTRSAALHIFVSCHLPVGPAVGAMVICPPLLAESVRNYRREAALGRALAARGIGVARFHYRNTGYSDGDGNENLDTMRADALVAARYLVERTGVVRPVWLGTRASGVIAAAAGSQTGGGPLLLWQPVVDPTRYWREVFRARLMQQLKEGSNGVSSEKDLIGAIRSTGALDVAGYKITSTLYDAISEADLESEINTRPRPVLIMDMNLSGKVPAEHSALARRLTGMGSAAETRVIEGREAWWFGAAGKLQDKERVPDERLIEASVEWITARATSGRTE
jgi:hypothetical protein